MKQTLHENAHRGIQELIEEVPPHQQHILMRMAKFLQGLPLTTPSPTRIGVTTDDEGYMVWPCAYSPLAVEVMFVDGHPPTMHLYDGVTENGEYVGYFCPETTVHLSKWFQLGEGDPVCH